MKNAVIREKLPNYLKATKAEKGIILDHVQGACSMPRKSIIRAFGRLRRRSGVKPLKRAGRKPYYTRETEAALSFIWEQYEYPCAERLHGEVAEAIRIFVRDGMWDYSQQATEQLCHMSLGAMKVRTASLAKKRGLIRGISTTKRGELIKAIPVFFGSWKAKGPGHGQLDTCVHSGPKLMGNMVYTTLYIDVATYWQEPVAQLNKSETSTVQSLKIIRQRLPFPIHEFHPDSGSEFINDVAYKWCQDVGIKLTRSRPHKSNDNCYVEQRNLVVVRKYVGYERYDCPEAVAAMNELYEVLRLYLNFFQPTYKLVAKKKIVNREGAQAVKHYRRVYDKVRTPYRRVLDHQGIDQTVKDQLTAQYETLNPKVLRDRIKVLTTKLERIQREMEYHY